MPKLSDDLPKKIRRIHFRTLQLAKDIFAGAWHSAFKGRGMQFEEVREYFPGDEIRSIDWNVTARMNHPYVKVFQEERELTMLLVVDVSASSRFGSHEHLKRELIAEIGAVLAFSAIKNNDKVGLILFSDSIEKYIPPAKGTRHVLRVIRELLAFEPKGAGTNLLLALNFLGGVMGKTAICFLVSDFISPLYPRELSIISAKLDLIAICVSDPYDLSFPKMNLINLCDLESNQLKTIDAGSSKVLGHFREANASRLKELNKSMQKIGAGFIDIRTDLPYLAPMRKFFKKREVRH